MSVHDLHEADMKMKFDIWEVRMGVEGKSQWRSEGRICYWPGFLASLINRNWSDARQEIQARLYWGPSCSKGEGEQTTCSIACSLAEGGQACFLYGVRVGVCPRVKPEWVTEVIYPLPLVVVCLGPCSLLCFCCRPPAFGSLQKWQLGFLVSLYLVDQNLPQLLMHAVIFSPL